MDEAGLTRWLDVFQSGVRRNEPYGDDDLDHAVAAFHKYRGVLDPPVVVGHSEDQAWLRDSGLPAAGWLADARKQGDRLQVRFGRMPPLIRHLIDVGAYDKVSVELYPKGKPPEGIDADGIVIRRVALMGGELPQVKTLQGLADLWAQKYGERQAQPASLRYARQEALPGGTYLVFFECDHCKGTKDMDRKAEEKKLLDAGWSAESVAALSTVPDAAFTGLVADAVKRATPPPAPLVAPPIAAPVTPQLAAQFSELETRLSQADARLKATEARLAAEEAESLRRQQSDRAACVERFCERWVNEGYILPADADRTAKTPNLYHRMMTADGRAIRRFGETEATEFDSLVAEIEARGPGFARRYFGEKIKQPSLAVDTIEAEAREYAARRNKKAS